MPEILRLLRSFTILRIFKVFSPTSRGYWVTSLKSILFLKIYLSKLIWFFFWFYEVIADIFIWHLEILMRRWIIFWVPVKSRIWTPSVSLSIPFSDLALRCVFGDDDSGYTWHEGRHQTGHALAYSCQGSRHSLKWNWLRLWRGKEGETP